jgi:hypothetical protein
LFNCQEFFFVYLGFDKKEKILINSSHYIEETDLQKKDENKYDENKLSHQKKGSANDNVFKNNDEIEKKEEKLMFHNPNSSNFFIKSKKETKRPTCSQPFQPSTPIVIKNFHKPFKKPQNNEASKIRYFFLIFFN